MREENKLISLARQEDDLVARLGAMVNQPDQTAFKRAHAQVSQHYKLLYHEYVELLLATSDAAIRLEILKRTVFLRWYVVTEPDWYTGLGYIDPFDTSRVFEILDTVISQNQLDAEFDWMLAYYALDGWDFALQPTAGEGGPWHKMAAFLGEKTALSAGATWYYSPVPVYVDPDTIAGRGQLSQYWMNIINRKSLP